MTRDEIDEWAEQHNIHVLPDTNDRIPDGTVEHRLPCGVRLWVCDGDTIELRIYPSYSRAKVELAYAEALMFYEHDPNERYIWYVLS